MGEDAKKPLGRILLQQKAITQAELDEHLTKARLSGVPLATELTESGAISEVAALKALSEQKGVPGIDLNQICVRLSDLDVLPREIALRHKLLPVLTRDDRLFCAMSNPTDKKVIDELEFVTGKRVFAYIALDGPLLRTISAAYDLLDRGETHFIGKQCPEEVQRKAGVREVKPPEAPTAVVAKVPAAPAIPAVSAAPAVFASPPTSAAPLERTEPEPEPPPPSPSATPAVLEPMPSPAPAAPPRPVSSPAASKPAASKPATSRRPAVSARPIIPRDEPDSSPPAPREEVVVRPSREAPKRGAAPLPRTDEQPEQSFRPSTSAMRAVNPSSHQVVVDDQMEKNIEETDFSDVDFDVSSDVSVVAALPTEPTPPSEDDLPADAKTLLVVDDEPDIRKLLRKIFSDRGYRVREADRGLLALQMVKHDPPDVLILDAMLPELHGFDIARKIRGSERYGHIPIVMISAVYRGWRFAEDAKTSYGVDAYLEKPFKVTDVLKAVETCVSTPSRRSDPEAISKDAERLLAEGIAAYKAGDLDTATSRLEQGTKLDPLAYRLHFHLGLLYGKKGQLYDAIQELETALQINDAHFPAVKNLAVLYQKAGFRNKAIETWERALSIAPDEDTRKTIKEHLLGLL